VGIPGRIVRIKDERVADEALMDHIHIPDPIADRFIELQLQIDGLRKELDKIREGKH
jgi:serine O-acetyltransferase